jgi:hypothetical protein
MFPPARTGTSFYSANLLRELEYLGNDVSLITFDNVDGSNSTSIDNKSRIYTVPSLNFAVKGWFKHFRICSILPSNFYKVHKIVKSEKPDVIILGGFKFEVQQPVVVWCNTSPPRITPHVVT